MPHYAREEAQRQMNGFADVVGREWGSWKTEIESVANLQIPNKLWPQAENGDIGETYCSECCLKKTEAMITSLEPGGIILLGRLVHS